MTNTKKNTKASPPIQKHFEHMFNDWTSGWLTVLRGKSLGSDVLAAFTVAAVALPLNIALAVACGLPASAGLIAGAIGGAIAAIFGGAPLQVTGPAAALNLMVLVIAKDFGAAGVAASCLLVAVVQITLSSFAAGRFIRYVPEAVLAGFTTGVGLTLLNRQIPELLGFDYSVYQLAEMMHRPAWLHEVSWLAVVSGLFVALLVTNCKQFHRFPAALIAIALVTAVSARLEWNIERVGTIPSFFPLPSFPMIRDDQWLPLIIATLPMALLAAIESLLSAQAIDRLSGAKKPHNSNLELLGQGLANLGSGLFSGMPVSGVVVRSSVNVQSGGKTRLSSLLHALILLVSILYLADVLAIIPLSALAGLLCVVGWRLIEIKTLKHLLQSHRLEAVAFLLTAAGTVTGHLLSGLVAGIGLCFVSQLLSRRPMVGSSAVEMIPDMSDNQKKGKSIRASLTVNPRRRIQMRPSHYVPATSESPEVNWLAQIKDRTQKAASAFVHHKASIIGRVVMGEHVHVAAESSVRADEGSPFYIGSNSNIQDGVVIHALKERWVNIDGEDWAVYIGENVSVAHQALIHGPCFIGNQSFIGFQAVVHDSVVGANCYVGIGAVVVGVEVPPGRYIPHGMVVDSLDKVEQLQSVTETHVHFNDDVVGVNKGLAAAYLQHSGEKAPANSRPLNRHSALARLSHASRHAPVDRF